MTLVLEPTLVDGDIDSEFFLAARKATSVAWDIETTGLSWFDDQIGTVQIALPSGEAVIVMIHRGHIPENLSTLIEIPSVRKIFHFAPFDLGFMVKAWGVQPQNVVCTKVLSKILNPGAPAETHKLQTLLLRELGIHLPKPAVRTSNWMTASLTPEQIDYAAGDVRHLHDLFDVLMARAIDAGVAGLAERSFEYLPTRVLTDLRGCGDIFDY